MTDLVRASQDFMRAADKSTTLYALSDEYLTLVELLEDPEVDPHLVEQELERIGGEIKHKAEAIAGLVRWYEGLADLRKAESKRMADSVKAFENKADWLRRYVLQNMQATGIERIDTARFTLAVKQNPPRVEVLEEMLVPEEFKRRHEVVDVDKRAILAYTKASGEIVPGTDVVRGTRLEIR
jgi:hypothetical protein